MTRLNRILLIVLVVQLGLLVAVRLASRSDHKTTPQEIFAGLDQAKITTLKVEDDKQQTVALAKKGDGWVLASGGDYPADKNKVSDFLGKLPGLKAGPPVATKAAHHRALEVADKGFQRRVTLVGEGGQETTFYLGSSAGIRSVHLRKGGEEVVYLADGLTAWDAGTNASDWVDTEYFKVDKDKLVSLRLKNATGEIALEKDAQGGWTMAGIKPEDKLDSAAVDTLISTASSVSLKQPVGKTLAPDQGLAQPVATVTLVTETKTEVAPAVKGAAVEGKPASEAAAVEGKPAVTAEGALPAAGEPAAAAPPAKRTTYSLRIGAKQDDSYFVKSESSPYVVRVAPWAVDQLLTKKPADLLKKEDQGQGAAGAPLPADLPLMMGDDEG